MPVRISLGVNKKLGLPAYSSVGASCQLEFEAESSLLREDLGQFFRKVHHAYGACTRAVDEQLARCQAGNAPGAAQGADMRRPSGNGKTAAANGHGNGRANGNANGNGSHVDQASNGATDRSVAASASSKQLAYARQLAAQVPGLGTRRLEKRATNLLGKPPAQLSSAEANVLIQTLTNLLSGDADLEALLEDTGLTVEQ